MLEWCIKHWNIWAALILLGITFLILNRDSKKLEKEVLSRDYSNPMPEVSEKDVAVIQQSLFEALSEEPPIKLVQGTSHIDIPILKTTGDKCLQLWRNLRSAVEITGYWPVILGDRSQLETASVRLGEATETVENLLRAAQAIDVKKWFRRRVATDPDFYLAPEGEWSDDVLGINDYSSPLDSLNKQPQPEVFLALVPTKSSWEVPIYLQIGGWDNIPLPEENTAIMKYWNDLYGAELVAVQSDTFELQVTRPPSQKRAALQLAKEHCAFCPDVLVDQTFGTIGPMLRKSNVWFFWWD